MLPPATQPPMPIDLRVKVDLDDDSDDHDHEQVATPAPAPTSAELPATELPTNVFIVGLPSSWTTTKLRDRLSCFGTVLSVRLVPHRHYGFAQFKEHASAAAAIEALHHTTPEHSRTILHVSFAMHSEGSEEKPNERIFIRGLPPFATVSDLDALFGTFGTIVDSSVITTSSGQCKGSGFVRFETVEAATSSIAALAGAERTFIEPSTGRPFTDVLDVKYCETPEMRRARQTKNHERMRSQDPTPKGAAGIGVGMTMRTPATTPASVSTSATGTPVPVLNPMAYTLGGAFPAVSPPGSASVFLPKTVPLPPTAGTPSPPLPPMPPVAPFRDAVSNSHCSALASGTAPPATTSAVSPSSHLQANGSTSAATTPSALQQQHQHHQQMQQQQQQQQQQQYQLAMLPPASQQLFHSAAPATLPSTLPPPPPFPTAQHIQLQHATPPLPQQMAHQHSSASLSSQGSGLHAVPSPGAVPSPMSVQLPTTQPQAVLPPNNIGGQPQQLSSAAPPPSRQCVVLQTPLPRFPWDGDVFFSSPGLTADVVLQLCAQFGEAEMLVPMNGGFAVRMANAVVSAQLAQCLNGSAFFGGNALQCAVIKL